MCSLLAAPHQESKWFSSAPVPEGAESEVMNHKLPASVTLTFFLTAILASVSLSSAASAQTLQNSRWSSNDVLRTFKLVSNGSGWVTTGPRENGNESNRLYWTDDNGQTWREITPQGMPTKDTGQVFFLDRSRGWILSTDTIGAEKNAPFFLFSTHDGGKHWRTLTFQRPMFKLANDYSSPTQIFFFDAEHGWIFWHWHFMNSSHDALLSSTDGGQTWKRMPDPPGSGPAQFLTANDGWMIGGPEDDSVGRPERFQLWNTRNGGASWDPAPIPIPKTSADEGFYLIALRFRNMREGMVAAGLQTALGGATYGFANCLTQDSGKSWRFSQFNASQARPSIGNKHIFWSVDRRETKTTLQMGSESISFALPSGVSHDGYFGDLDFLDDSNAWVQYRDRSQLLLLSTTNNGRTAKVIWPPLIPSSSTSELSRQPSPR